jgi:ribosomal RNA-processing protein 12
METALAKIRPHTSSSLAHQKIPAGLLRALEVTFRERATECTPTAYFAALLTTLEATLRTNDTKLDEGDRLPAELYLLATVIPFVPPPIIRANLKTLLSLTGPLFPSLLNHAPPLRSQLTVYHTVLLSLDRTQLDVQGVRQIFSSILQLCLDPRPKVRRKAAEVVKDVLATPPTPLARHPYAQQVAEWLQSTLSEANSGVLARPKSTTKGSELSAADTAIHILTVLRPIIANLPPHVSHDVLTYFPEFTPRCVDTTIHRRSIAQSSPSW